MNGMRSRPLPALILWIAFAFSGLSYADAPATEFFAIETSRLTKLAPTNAALDSLSSNQLAEVSMAHGWYGGGLAMRFDTVTFRLDARFSASAHTPTGDPASIGYNISASKDPMSWSLSPCRARPPRWEAVHHQELADTTCDGHPALFGSQEVSRGRPQFWPEANPD